MRAVRGRGEQEHAQADDAGGVQADDAAVFSHAQALEIGPITFMTQDELWIARWQDAIDFLETYHRKPSKFVPEVRNWWKHNKKLMNAGELKAERVEMFKQLLELGGKYKHVNQYQ